MPNESRPEPEGGGSDPQNLPSFEKALEELEGIVDDLENGSLALEESLNRFERGVLLSRILQTRLREAEARVRRLADGDAAPAGASAPEPEQEEPEEEEHGGNRLF